MKDCIFCKIVSGAISSYKVYEDDTVLAFLDIHPLRPGHVLVTPKKHNPDLHRLDDETYGNVMQIAKRLANTIEDKLKPKRVGFLVAGWDVPHAHVHVVPMEDINDLTSKIHLDGHRGSPTPEEFENMREALLTS